MSFLDNSTYVLTLYSRFKYTETNTDTDSFQHQHYCNEKQLSCLFLILPNNKLQVQSCVFRTISRSRSASSSAVINGCLSSLPLCTPGLLAFGTPLGAARGLCCGSTQRNVSVGRCAFTWPSVNNCSAAVAAHPGHNRDHRQPDRRLGSWVPI